MSRSDFEKYTILVADSNITARSIIVSQLREFGVINIYQASKAIDARRHMETRQFDFVLCEQHFNNDIISGKDLLDDLRRNNILPLSTVFIMITSESSYAWVAEAIEAALDAYILKPHKASSLISRLRSAKKRKVAMDGVFSAIDKSDFELACNLCIGKFKQNDEYSLYAARIGAELCLRLGQNDRAQEMYRAVSESKTLPWAKLGLARAQLMSGNTSESIATIEKLIASEPNYVDAYDIMGKAQFETGNIKAAVETYKMAHTLTPTSISRIQSLALMTYYSGDHNESEQLLDRAMRIGLGSKMFDPQNMVLIAFVKFKKNDVRSVDVCVNNFKYLIDKNPLSERLFRLNRIVQILQLIQYKKLSNAVQQMREVIKDVMLHEFDFESAANFVTLASFMASRSIKLDEVSQSIIHIGMRFCVNRTLTDLLVAGADVHMEYNDLIRDCHTKIFKYAGDAVSLAASGDKNGAIQSLLHHGKNNLNMRLIDNASKLLERHYQHVINADMITIELNELKIKLGRNHTPNTLTSSKGEVGGLLGHLEK